MKYLGTFSSIGRVIFLLRIGEFSFSVSGSEFNPNGCFNSISRAFHPQLALGNGEWEDGTDVIIDFNNLQIFTSLTYDYAFASDIYNMTVSIIGHGTGGGGGCNIPCANCNGLLTRNYSYFSPQASRVAIEDTSRVLACRGRIDFEPVIDQETGLTVLVMQGIYYCGAESVFENVIVTHCPTGEECSVFGANILFGSRISGNWYVALVPPAIYEQLLYFPYDGGFDPYIWSYSDSGEGWSKSASMAITVGFGQ